MKKEMSCKVSGAVGTKVVRTNFNADLNGQPRQLTNGEFFINNQPLKHCIKKHWEERGIPVLALKSYQLINKGGVEKRIPRTQEERYNLLFDKIDKKKTGTVEILKNLGKCEDVRNFGITFTAADNNVGITGVVQILPGMNKMEDTSMEVINLNTPFRNSNKEDSMASSMGIKYILDEAHFFSDIAITPSNLEPYKEYGIFYTEEDYFLLKEGLLKGVRNLNTGTRMGCNNEFIILIRSNENNDFSIPLLTDYITFKKGENGGNDQIDLSRVSKVINRHVEDIKDIEIYYNIDFIDLVGFNTTIPSSLKPLY